MVTLGSYVVRLQHGLFPLEKQANPWTEGNQATTSTFNQRAKT